VNATLRRLLAVALILLVPAQAFSATCFWVGGTGTLDGSTDAAHLSSSSGGAGSTCAGTGGHIGATDSLTLDASSGGGTVTFGTSVTTSGTLTCGAFTGTLADGGRNQTWSVVSLSGSGTRTINWTAAEWDITSNASGSWDATTITNLTNTSMPTLIKFSGSATSMVGGGLTYNDVSFTGGSTSAAITSTGNNTFRDLTVSIGTGAWAFGSSNNTFRNVSVTSGTCNVGGAANRTITGNLTINTSTSCIVGGTFTLAGTSGVQLVTTNGMAGNTSNWAVNNSGSGVIFDSLTTAGAVTNTAGNGTFTGALSAGGAYTLTAGNFTALSTVSSASFSSSNSNVRSISIKKPWTLTGTGNFLNLTTSTNFTATCPSGVGFVFTDSSATNKTVLVSGTEIMKCLKYFHGSATNGWTVTP
jgi:hypothetical protein